MAKIRAAASARRDPDFVIIARTDARAVNGFDDAIERANAALSCGADVAFVEAVRSMDELQAVPKLVNGPCLLNIVVGGKTPDLDLGAAREMGYRIAIMPSLLITTVMESCDAVLANLKQSDRPPSSDGRMTVKERFDRFGAEYWNGLRTKFHETPKT